MKYQINRDRMLERFLSYVKVWTTSDETNEATPSTDRQWVLAKQLKAELEALGVENVRLSDHCYVYATLPENLPEGSDRAGKIPSVALIAHVDVSDAVPGENVKPIIHEKYAGGPIQLPGDPSVVLTPEADPPLGDCKGLDIVTSDGTTLLGADDKAGIAIIMSVLEHLENNGDVPHGPVQVCFTPDEEIGRGVDKIELDQLNAEVAYTLDGETLGEVEDETFCADSFDITFRGVNVHPGFAKGKMINSIKLAAEFIESLPKDGLSPETTEGREGYVHPRLIQGNEEGTEIKLLVRHFEMSGLAEYEKLLEEKARAVVAAHPGSDVEFVHTHSYKNMKSMLDQRPEAMALAEEAIRAAGVEVIKHPIRGGTDGARLSFMGLPTPNLFTGGHNYHGKKEWIPVQHMEKSAEVVLRLLELYAQKGTKQGMLPAVE